MTDHENEATRVDVQPAAPLIYAALAAITREMPAVGKDARNDFHKYAYRSIDAVCNAAHSLLGKHGVTCVTKVVGRSVEPYEKKKQGSPPTRSVHAVLDIQYTFYALDGSSVEVVTVGENDSAEGACTKAMVAGYKYALTQLFCMATMNGADGDAGEGSGQPSGADAANDLLAEKQEQRSADSLFFDAEADKLAARDLPSGWGLSPENYGTIYNDVANLVPGVDGGRKAGEWLRDHGELYTVTGDDGVLEGIAARPREHNKELPGMTA